LKIFSKAALAVGLAGTIGIGMSGVLTAYAATPVQVTGAGSDTTYFAMAALSNQYNGTQSGTVVTQIPPKNGSPFPNSVTVAADDTPCGSYTWDSSDAAHTPPFGSSAGITALQNDDASANPSCKIDFARSSRGLGNPSDTGDLESFAFALDAVTWAIPAINKHGVTNLSITKIYTCNTSGPQAGKPKIGNWAQLGSSKPGPIVKYAPQLGSGTLSFFQTKLLNGAVVDAGCDGSHLSTRIEENEYTDPAIDHSTDLNAITPYSFAVWTAQKNAVIADRRNTTKLQKVEGIKPSTTTINEGTDPNVAHFEGTRYVFNILTQNEPTYAQSAAFAGINQNTLTNGYLCQVTNSTARGKVVTIVKKQGFVPLPTAVEGAGQPSGACRFNPTPL
jgi:ABC-type phosphate transport system substrate-binding protein